MQKPLYCYGTCAHFWPSSVKAVWGRTTYGATSSPKTAKISTISQQVLMFVSTAILQEVGGKVSTLSIAIKTFISIHRRKDPYVEQIHVWAQSYHSFSIILFIFFWLRVWSRFTVLITTTWNILQMTGHEFIALLQCILLYWGDAILNEIPYHTLVE